MRAGKRSWLVLLLFDVWIHLPHTEALAEGRLVSLGVPAPGLHFPESPGALTFSVLRMPLRGTVGNARVRVPARPVAPGWERRRFAY